MSIEQGNIFKDYTCIIQSNAYYNAVTNIAKKLREIFKGYLNTFFSIIPSVYNSKVINFAVHQQDVNEVR